SVSVISVPFLNLGDKKPGGNIKFTNPRQSGAQGKLELNGETITAVAPFVIDGGLILGSGTLVGSVVNSGAMFPGGPGLPGLLTVNGNLAEANGGSINIDVNGTTPQQSYDQVKVTGFANLAGTLNVVLNGYTPLPTDTFKILDLPGGYTGTFSAFNDPAFGSY